jgi:hypothetical protein
VGLELDLSETSIVDMHAAEMLAGLASEFTAKGIKIQAVEAHSQVRDRLRGEGLGRDSAGSNGSAPSPTWRTIFCEGVRQNPDEPVLDRP